MSYYLDRIVPRVVNMTCGPKTLRRLRERVCEGLVGDVVEVGFGSGLNLACYPEKVTRIAAIEPSDLAWRLARKRLAASNIPVERAGLDAQRLPFADDTFDAALTTWSLCTIPDATAALHELHRVLKGGAALHFLEHGLAPDSEVQRWQRRLDPIEKRLAGGCTFTRPIVELLTGAEFEISEVETFYQKGGPKFANAFSLGTALASGAGH